MQEQAERIPISVRFHSHSPGNSRADHIRRGPVIFTGWKKKEEENGRNDPRGNALLIAACVHAARGVRDLSGVIKGWRRQSRASNSRLSSCPPSFMSSVTLKFGARDGRAIR